MSLFLTVAGMLAFTVSAFTLANAAGWAILGAQFWYLEYLTRQDTP